MENRNEERRTVPDRRRFLRTAALLGTGLALGATSCSQGEKTQQTPNATPKAAKEIQEPAPPTTEAPRQNVFTPQPTRPYTAAPNIAPADTPSGVINVALIGCGQQGRTLLDSIHKDCPRVRTKAVCDISPFNRKYAQNLLTKAFRQDVMDHGYEDYREMLACEKDLDAVLIATPDWMHAEQTIACLESSLHVYCEKEMSNDLEKAREMVQVSRKTGKLLQIGRQRRSNPRYRFALDHVICEPRLLGTVTHAYSQWNRSVAVRSSMPLSEKSRPPAEILEKYGYGSLEAFSNWRWYRKYGGGPICDLGSHQIDVLSWFLGSRPRKVLVNGGRDYWNREGKPYEWYDNVRAIYEFPTPAGMVRAQCQVLTTTSAMGYFECFMGTQGTLTVSEKPSRCRVFPEGWLNATPQGDHPWAEFEKKGHLVKANAERTPYGLFEGADITRLYCEDLPPSHYLLNCRNDSTLHGPHLNNFFNAIRGTEKLNCPGEVGYECAVQVLKVNQLLDAGQDSGTFKESDFKV